MPSSPAKSKKQIGKRPQNYSTRLRIAAQKRAQMQQKLKEITFFPKTAKGFFKLGIFACDSICDKFGISRNQMWNFLAPIFGRSPDTLRLLATELRKKLPLTNDLDLYTTQRTDTIQKQVVHEVLSSYWDDEGSLLKNPTYLELVDDIAVACKDVNIGVMCKKTVLKYVDSFNWGFKSPSNQTNLNKPETTAKRVEFAKYLLELLDDPTSVPLFMDEMSFFVFKNRAKRLAPKNHDKVFFEPITPSRHPALNITTYMTPDNIIHMHFKKETTKTDNFEQELYQALVHADCCIDQSKKIVLILDNAPWHNENNLKDVINEVLDERKRRLKREKIGYTQRIIDYRFTSPNSPDLNLVEFFIHYYKATLRRALDKFKYITFKRPDGRGRPSTKPKKKTQSGAKSPKIVVAFSFRNLTALVNHVYRRIQASERAAGNWLNTLNHIRKWASAFIETQGSTTHATAAIATDNTPPPSYIIQNGSSIDRLKVTRISTRLHGLEYLPVGPPACLEFTEDEVNYVAVEGYDGWEPEKSNLSDLEDDLIADDGSDEEEHEEALSDVTAPVKRKAQAQLNRPKRTRRSSKVDVASLDSD